MNSKSMSSACQGSEVLGFSGSLALDARTTIFGALIESLENDALKARCRRVFEFVP